MNAEILSTLKNVINSLQEKGSGNLETEIEDLKEIVLTISNADGAETISTQTQADEESIPKEDYSTIIEKVMHDSEKPNNENVTKLAQEDDDLDANNENVGASSMAEVTSEDSEEPTNTESIKSNPDNSNATLENDSPEESLMDLPLTPENIAKATAMQKKVIIQQPKIYQAANGQVGIDYQLSLNDLGLDGIEILGFDNENHTLEDIGLNYNNETNELIGKPLQPGEFEFKIKYNYPVDSAHKPNALDNRILKVLVNPDPRSLWQTLEPPEDSIFKKPHFDFARHTYGGRSIIGGSIRGRSHAHAGTHRDDDFIISQLSEEIVLLVVADGAGSAEYSREGSRLACDACDQSLKKNEEKLKQLQRILIDYDESKAGELSGLAYELLGGAVKSAIDALKESSNEHSHNLKDYSTTLLFSIIIKRETDFCVISYGLGDGIAALVDTDFSIQLLTAPDSGTHAGQTRFITMGDTLETIQNRIRAKFTKNIHNMFLMTDGISDVYFETDSKLEDVNCWKKLMDDMNGAIDFDGDRTSDEFKEWINFFSKGNHDDRTIIWIR